MIARPSLPPARAALVFTDAGGAALVDELRTAVTGRVGERALAVDA